ncbi:DUF2569 domain-containing protein [Enterobacter asburiae]|uniref:DUF2569 domain-containing protein n=1 Tax=unclassified Scandinavium TaxID=2830652 RepID=UPI00289FED1F|nr:DUF2569 domain-containing protein [Scandinavium sp.]
MTTEPTERIGGWLLAPLAWLIVALISVTLTTLNFIGVLFVANLKVLSTTNLVLIGFSLLFGLAMWCYTLWLTAAFFKRRRLVPKHYIIWLLIMVLLAVKTFAFAPVSDALALRQLLFPLLATALLVPYFKRSERVKRTFVKP